MEENINLTSSEENVSPDTAETPVTTEETVAVTEETPVTENIQPENTNVSYESAPAEVAAAPKKNLVPLFVSLGIAVVLIAGIIAVAINRNIIYAKIAPEAYCIKAASKALTSFESRLDATPFGITNDIDEAMQNGSITANTEIISEYDGIENKVAVDFEVARNIENNENKFYLALDMMGVSADLTGFANDSRLIFFSSLFGDEVYGMNYDNVVSRLNDKLGLGMEETEISQLQTEIDNAKNQADFNINDYEKSFLSLRDKFLETMKPEVSYEKTDLQGEEVKCIAVKYTVEKEDMIALLNEYLEIVKNDEEIKEAINLYPSQFGYSYSDAEEGKTAYEAYLEEIENLIADVEEEYQGTLHIDLYSNTSGCLVKVLVHGDTTTKDYDDELYTTYYKSILDLGKNPKTSNKATFALYYGEEEINENETPYYIKASYVENENSEKFYSSEIMATISEKSYSYYTDEEEIQITDFSLNTTYDKSSENLTLKFKGNSSFDDEPEEFSITGKFSRNADGARIEIKDFTPDEEDFDNRINFSMDIAKKATVTAPESYKELDDWTDEDINNMKDGIQDFIMRLIYGDSYSDYMY